MRQKAYAVPLLALLSALLLLGMLLFVRPGSAPAGERVDLLQSLQGGLNRAASEALGGIGYIRKIYTIDPYATVAPAPDPAGFGETEDPADILLLAEEAAELLDGQTLCFDPEAEFFPDTPIRYYRDESILVIVWKEVRMDKVLTCAEVKIAHGSQLRRKLAADSYGSPVQMKASDMAREARSVVSINGDFYAFRDLGITGYQGRIYRCKPASVDSCFFTEEGEMLFSYAGELSSKEEAQAFMEENRGSFAVAFGPVLVDGGEKNWVGSYPLGEIFDTYSRSAIGQLDELHYLLLTLNYDEGYTVAASIYQLTDIVHQLGCQKAYALDGGQTAVITLNGQVMNHVDWGRERDMSDIIYFASALPEGGD